MHVFAGPVMLTTSGMRMHCVPIPVEVADALGDARAVVGTISDVPFRRAVHGRADGTPHLRFGRVILRRAGLALGETAFVELEAADPDAVHVPPELAAALDADAQALARWQTFTPGQQRSLGVHVEQAVQSATRERRALELAHKIRTHTLHSDREG